MTRQPLCKLLVFRKIQMRKLRDIKKDKKKEISVIKCEGHPTAKFEI